jgi:hypothetical protein
MVNPMKAALDQFVKTSPTMLLGAGIAVSLLDFLVLYGAAVHDRVLNVPGGIGLFQDYGLFSTLIGNAVFIYLARAYYNAVRSFRNSNAVINDRPVSQALSVLTAMIRMKRQYRFLIYMFIVIGSAAWVSNTAFQVFGNPEIRWGHKVFDSPDHMLTFLASRAHNVYTWMFIYPILAHVVLYTFVQLRWGVLEAARQRALRYDVLNSDHRGGFAFVEKAHIAFNLIVALAYIQVTIHIETFSRMNAEHLLTYIALTMLLIGVNRTFLSDMYTTLNDLKLEALNKVKDKALNGDNLSFEILRYCYERRVDTFGILNVLIKAGAIAVSVGVKLLPWMSKGVPGAP